jgi:hypothetical protein
MLMMTGDFAPILARLAGLPNWGVSLYVAVGFGMMAAAGATVAWGAKRLGGNHPMLLPIVAPLFALACYWNAPLGLLLLFVWTYALGLSQNLYNRDLQNRVPSEVRATVLSVSSLGMTVVDISLLVATGAVAKETSYSHALTLFGLFSIAVGLILWLRHRRAPR